MVRRVAVVALATLVASAAFAQQPLERVLLRYGWEAGDELVWDMESEVTGEVTIEDHAQDPPSEQYMTMWVQAISPVVIAVESLDAEGNATIAYSIGRIAIDMAMGGEQQYIVMDPESGTMTVDGEEVPMPPQSAMPGFAAPMTMVVSNRGEVLEFDPGTAEGVATTFGGVPGMDLSTWMQEMRQSQMVLPEEPVPVGYVWAGTLRLPFGEGTNAMEATMVYTLSAMERVEGVECARIDLAGAVDFDEMMPGALMGALSAGGEQPEIETVMGPGHMSISGTTWFDPARGQPVRSEVDVLMDLAQRIHGTVTTPEGEQQVDTLISLRDIRVRATMLLR